MNYDNLPSWWPSDKPWIIQDCLEGMKSIPDKAVDLVLTDPPYGVGFAEWDMKIPDGWLDECRRVGKRVAFTPGIWNVGHYPQPKWILCWAKPGSTRRNATGGFNHWEPIFYYGDGRISVDFTYLPDCVNHVKGKINHPCPKPIALYEWLIEALSDSAAVVLDPFLGSGTTLLACRKTGRIGLGFEINPEYESIIRERSMADVPELKGIFDWRNEPEPGVVSK